MLLASFSTNLLLFNHECCSLIGYATHYNYIILLQTVS